MTRVFSIFERIGLGGGGKVRAVYHRLNAFAEMSEFDPILLNLDHNPNQKLKFAELQSNGTIAQGVRYLTVPEACHDAAVAAGIQPFSDFPEFDEKVKKGKKVVYLKNGETVMVDREIKTPIGKITKRAVLIEGEERLYKFIDGNIHQLIERHADGFVEITDFAYSLPVRWTKTQAGKFVIGKNLITDTICRMERIYGQNVFEMIEWDKSVVFFDGVTSAYLSPVTKAQRALFLHADHRGPDGEIVPRSKFLIENFDGEAIITSTNVHKAQIEADLAPSAKLFVIPHFCEIGDSPEPKREHLVTVSRLELTGKPIHECIEAFCRIKDDFPEVDYLIYGEGAGREQLEAQIAELGCEDRVQLAGYTTEPLAIFRGALASVYPTTTEGFGLSILEALSNSCPVISYDVNYGPREMITPGVNGELALPGDIAVIAQAMRRVLLDPLRYQRDTNIGLERYARSAYLLNYRDTVNILTGSS